MRYLALILLALPLLFAPSHSPLAADGPTPTPSDHVIFGTPTAVPVAQPSLAVVWLRPSLAHASWVGFACLHRYDTLGVHLFVGCATDSLDTEAQMGDMFAIAITVNGNAAASERSDVRGAVLLPITRR